MFNLREAASQNEVLLFLRIRFSSILQKRLAQIDFVTSLLKYSKKDYLPI